MAIIWRGGCIIRARFLDRISRAYAADPALPTPADRRALPQRAGGRAVRLARGGRHGSAAGCARPGLRLALAYYDALRAPRLPAALVQGQRDFFGAHTYRRVDRPGSFHTLWGGDRTEVTR